ncbi:Tripartite motif containing 37 [Cyanidiococcus yangmingshanensis]|uniref:Tripartite motif containing 37 n=1 Tax=Cyanidiococcus yangmingshanensis TaxID=2690220 RepID=A0A7J7IQC1_9RHOD|nr:Tripartite motif containing 37 [Cyanidiococcus yangmingshanensis]
MDSGTDLSSLESSDAEAGLSEATPTRLQSPPLSSDSEELERDELSEPLDWMHLVGRLARLCRTGDIAALSAVESETTLYPERLAGGATSLPRASCAEQLAAVDSRRATTPRPPSSLWNTQLENFLSCVICTELPREPLLCPYCGVLFCEQCASRWWHESGTSPSLQRHRSTRALPCPHCRHAVTRHELVLVRCVRDLLQVMRERPKNQSQTTKSIASLETVASTPSSRFLRCESHPSEIVRYFCQACDRFVCAECCSPLPEGEHRHHPLQRASERIQVLALELEQALRPLRERLRRCETRLRHQEHTSRMLLEQREVLSQRIQTFMDEMIERVDEQVQTRMRSLQAFRQQQTEMRNRLTRLVREIEDHLGAFRNETARPDPEQPSKIHDRAESLMYLHQEWKQCAHQIQVDRQDEPADEHRETVIIPSIPGQLPTLSREEVLMPLTCDLVPPFVYTRIPGQVTLVGFRWRIQWLPACSDDLTRRHQTRSGEMFGTSRRSARRAASTRTLMPLDWPEHARIALTLERRPELEDDWSANTSLILECAFVHKSQTLWCGFISVGPCDQWQTSLDLSDCLADRQPTEHWSLDDLQLGLRFPDIVQHSQHQTRYIHWLEKRHALSSDQDADGALRRTQNE